MSANQATSDQKAYVLGHSGAELGRLEEQSRFYRELTLRFFADAGVGPGQRVLDVGCGAGDVSLLASELVGDSGCVIGIDRNAAALDTARARANATGATNMKFVEADAGIDGGLDVVTDKAFDAIIGRFVLMYLREPAAALRRVAALAKPNATIAFIEMDLLGEAYPGAAPTWMHCLQLIRETYTKAGLEPLPGLKLYSWYVAAGLTPRRAQFFGRTEGGPTSPAYGYVEQTMRSLLPMMERFGVTTAQALDVDTIAERMRSETLASGGSLRMPTLGAVST